LNNGRQPGQQVREHPGRYDTLDNDNDNDNDIDDGGAQNIF
jgi:hypothetical protein